MLARERKGVGVSVRLVSSVLYDSMEFLELFELSECSVPAVTGLGSEGSLLCL